MKQSGFPEIFPTLETRRLILKELTSEETAAVYRNFSDPEIARWFFEKPLEKIEQAQEFIVAFNQEFKHGEGMTWAVTLRDSETCIGTCGYGDLEIGQDAELGFDLAKELWGQGLMAEALEAVLAYGFEALDLGVVKAHTFTSNARAMRLLEKLGFQLQSAEGDSSYYILTKESGP